MKITTSVFRHTFVVSVCMAMLACQPPEQAGTPASTAVKPDIEGPAAVDRTPVYRSAMRLSSDCGVVRAPRPVPGLAPVAYAEVDEMSERSATSLAVGAERPMARCSGV